VPKPFGVATVDIAAERDQPQVCFEFTEPLQRPRPRGPRYDDFVTVAPDVQHGLVVRDRSLCVDGLAHGQSYSITLQQGLPAAGGATLAAPDQRDVAIPDRKPVISFRNSGYILPRLPAEGLPLRSINVSRARLQILRVADRALVERIYNGRLNQTLTDFEVGGLLDAAAEVVWRGEMAIGSVLNQPVVTPFPANAVLGDPAPGVYIAVASDAGAPADTWEFRSAQWFVVSDIGLTSFAGDDGLTVFARSLATAQPLAQAELRLVSRSNKELGKAVTGPDGLVHFGADQLHPAEGDVPQALYAASPAGDFSFLDVGGPAGRAPASALDVYLTTDRPAYRRGDEVKLIGLLRDAAGQAVVDQTLAFKVQRPDGLEVDRRRVADAGGGAYLLDFDLPSNAAAGRWQITVQADAADAQPLAHAQFQVEDVASSRVSLELDADRPRLAADGKAVISVEGAYLSQQPAAALPGELSVEVRPATNPFPQHAGYRFGLAQDQPAPVRTGLPGFTTGPEGAAAVPVQVQAKPEGSHPLEAAFTATVVDVGGRPVSQELVLPFQVQPFAIGIRPHFAGDALPEGATAGFDVIAVGPGGQPIGKSGLSFELYEEDLQYSWFEADGHWDYKTVVRDKRLTGGTVDTTPAAPGRVEEPVRTGRYRLEVFDTASGVASSVRFSAGPWVAPRVGETPDRVEVAVNPRRYKAGETASVFVRPPYDSTVVIAVADRRVRQVLTRSIGAKGEAVEIPVPADLAGGAYVIATAFAPGEAGRNLPARRAVGMTWIAADEGELSLGVSLDIPSGARPRQTVTIPVQVEGAEAGVPVKVLVTALEADGAAGAAAGRLDPAAWFHGRRRPAVEVRDVSGSLVETAPPAAGAGDKTGEDESASSDLLSLTSAVATVDADGTAPVTLELPDFQGSLRLTAVAWSARKLGRATGRMDVHDPVVIEVAAPRFLAPDDTAQVAIKLRNRSGGGGPYHLRLGAEGPLAIDRPKMDFGALKRGGAVHTVRAVKATGTGAAVLKLELTGPRGLTVTRDVPIRIRPGVPPVVLRREQTVLAPGKTVGLAAERAAGARPDGLRTVLTLNTLPLPDFAGLLLTGDGFAYGSADQTAGRILQQLYVNDMARALGLAADSELRARVQRDIDRLASLQRTDGGFALWAPDAPADPWVTPFALDALTRAREAGYRVSDASTKLGLDWLAKTVGNSWVEPFELPSRAYALYVAARAKAVDPGAARVFQDMFWSKLPTLLARTQTAAALALLGETDRARDAFGRTDGPRQVLSGMRDLGSELRDRAAALALMAESGLVDNDRLSKLSEDLSGRLGHGVGLSAEERAFVVLAAHGLFRKGPPTVVTLGGQRVESPEPVVKLLPPAPLTVANTGDAPLNRTLSVTGIPEAPPPQEKGYHLERKLFDPKGRPLAAGKLRAGDMVVVVLSGSAVEPRPVQSLVVDLLPAGLEVETVRIGQSAPLGGLSWLNDLTPANHVAFRDDRFVAAVELTPERPDFRIAYLARAVVPGSFKVPGTLVEDFAAPERFARTGAGSLVIAPR
jgi:uncharacterized protein YfaS (alpha-2-macroglobulin family)